MDKNNCYCVILAGGPGTRFWPMSKVDKPKQFLDVADSGKTFIRQTYERFAKVVPQENILIVTAYRYRELVMEQIPELDQKNLLLEPYSRNTAPAIAYATYTLMLRNPDAHVVVTPSDHFIQNEELFCKTIEYAFDFVAENDVLMTLGLVPTRPDSNYGYIQACDGRNAHKSTVPMAVKTFTEKPDKELAKVFIKTGEFFWNSGILVWNVRTIRKEMEKHLPAVTGLFNGWENALGTGIEDEFMLRIYTECPNISIDYGVMEKTDRAWMYPAKFDWQDIGSWESLYNFIPDKDIHGNVIGPEKHIVENCRDMLVITPDRKKKMVVIKGLEDFMIIDTDDALVICPKDDKKFKELISGIAMPEFEKYR
ncbi:MAG: mannose-1-phosphate guanylyltransferase [Bacteroidales bacterium]|nr:mannose-1-phosphate guanylyltransferase [Bacteroidales bacterium]